MARQFARWTRIPFIGLRFSAIREPAEYAVFPESAQDGAWNVWGYVDARDVAQSCRLALTAGRRRSRGLHHRRRRHRQRAPEPGADGRGLPIRADPSRDR
jgi:hypothetical protein